MNYLNNQVEKPRHSLGKDFLYWTIGLTLVAIGFGAGYYRDPDCDGLNSKEETAMGLDPQNADTDKDGVRDGNEDFTLFIGAPGPPPITVTNTICLTAPNGQKEVCFNPSDIILFTKGPGGYETFDWHGEVKYVQENLTAIDSIIRQTGYLYFYRVNPQDLANMLFAECLDKKNCKLYLVRDDSIWCLVPEKKLKQISNHVGPCK